MQQQVAEVAIEGKVAKVLNKRELVINRGAQDGVKDGMRFEVFEESEEFIDPETMESLGAITRSKIRVMVTDVQPRFSIARTYETYQVSEGASSIIHLGGRILTKVKTISEHDDGFSDISYERSRSVVRVGDKVVQMP